MATGIASFGIKHHPQGASWPWGGRTCIDVRRFWNPWVLGYKSLDPRVGEHIEADPHFAQKYAQLKAEVRQAPGLVCLYCTGGQHRSVYLADRIAKDLGLPPATHIDLEE